MMDSADPTRTTIAKQGALLGSREQAIQFQLARVSVLGESQAQLQAAVQGPSRCTVPLPEGADAAPESSPLPKLAPECAAGPGRCSVIPCFRSATSLEPDQFSGEPGILGVFKLQCEVVFSRSPQLFLSDSAKVSYLIGKLRGRALTWAHAYLLNHPLQSCSYDEFMGQLKKTFVHPVSEASIARKLLNLRQGRRSIADYLIDFRTAAAAAGWPDCALQAVYLQSLNETMKDQLAYRDEPATFEELASLTLRIDNRLRERERGRGSVRRPLPPFAPVAVVPVASGSFTNALSPPREESAPEPMQRGRSRLSPEERERRICAHACFYCGESDHLVATCPKKLKGVSRQ